MGHEKCSCLRRIEIIIIETIEISQEFV